jgi:23S rRNA (uracil1939-C5)-methyltransferase
MKNQDIPVRYKKGDVLTVEITDIGNDGEGIGKVEGYTLFIKDAVIGDLVKAKIMKAKKNYAYAHLEEVVEPSPFRQQALCPVARQCGGCQLQNMTYERQLQFKQNKVRNNIVRLGSFDETFVDGIMEPIIGMDDPWRYRNKAQYPIGTDKSGNPVAGFYAGRTHIIVPVNDCLIGVCENEAILDIILEHMKEFHVSAYDEVSGRGLARHVLIRKGFKSGQIMVCLVLNYGKKVGSGASGTVSKKSDFIPGQERLIDRLSKIDGMTSISVSINTEKTNVIMGTEIHTIWGRDTITDTLCGLSFEISPLSFYQVNPVQTEKLYGQAIEYAALTGREIVWDLYCGIGTITLSMASAAGKVYGIEIIPDAIEDAKRNAARNGIDNAEFFCGKAEVVLPEFYEKKSSFAEGSAMSDTALHPDVIVVDPPRKGCDEKCLETMLKMSPSRIVYVSCDSATLARDLRILVDGGYDLKKVRPCDMFSWSSHCETVALLSK